MNTLPGGGLDVVVEFVDFASGHRNDRPEYQRMFDAARKRRFRRSDRTE